VRDKGAVAEKKEDSVGLNPFDENRKGNEGGGPVVGRRVNLCAVDRGGEGRQPSGGEGDSYFLGRIGKKKTAASRCSSRRESIT